MKLFEPSRTYSPPRRAARVSRRCRSEPTLGSVKAKQWIARPFTASGRRRARWASSPCSRIAEVPMEQWARTEPAMPEQTRPSSAGQEAGRDGIGASAPVGLGEGGAERAGVSQQRREFYGETPPPPRPPPPSAPPARRQKARRASRKSRCSVGEIAGRRPVAHRRASAPRSHSGARAAPPGRCRRTGRSACHWHCLRCRCGCRAPPPGRRPRP